MSAPSASKRLEYPQVTLSKVLRDVTTRVFTEKNGGVLPKFVDESPPEFTKRVQIYLTLKEKEAHIAAFKAHKYYKANEAAIKFWMSVIPRELREMIIIKTLPATLILQFTPHAAALRIVRSNANFGFNAVDSLLFSYNKELWIKKAKPATHKTYNTSYVKLRFNIYKKEVTANPFDPDNIGPLQMAAQVGNEEVVDYYLSNPYSDAYVDVDTFIYALTANIDANKKLRIIRKLLGFSADDLVGNIDAADALAVNDEIARALYREGMVSLLKRVYKLISLDSLTLFRTLANHGTLEIFKLISGIVDNNILFVECMINEYNKSYIVMRDEFMWLLDSSDIETWRKIVAIVVVKDLSEYFNIILNEHSAFYRIQVTRAGPVITYRNAANTQAAAENNQAAAANDQAIRQENIRALLTLAVSHESAKVFNLLQVDNFTAALTATMFNGCPVTICRAFANADIKSKITDEVLRLVLREGTQELLWVLMKKKLSARAADDA